MASPHQSGFSLTELMVSLTVAGVLMGVGIPQLKRMTDRAALSAAANELLGDLALARSEAVTRDVRVSVCTSSTGTNCTGGGWGVGRLVFTDAGAIGAIDGTDLILKVAGVPKRSVSAVGSGGMPANRVSYVSTGQASATGLVTYCYSGEISRIVRINGTGSARVETGVLCP